MESRKITVFDTMTSQKSEYRSSAETFGQFKSEVDVDWTDKKVTVRETRVTLESDDAQLPESDIVLFLFKQKSKFGSGDKDESRVIKRLRRIERKIDSVIEILENLEDGEVVNEVDDELSKLQEEAEKLRKELEG